MRKLGEITNTLHRAQTLVLCDATSRYAGKAGFAAEIANPPHQITLGAVSGCIVACGFGNHVDVFELDGGTLALINVRAEGIDPTRLELARPASGVGSLTVPSGELVIAVADNPLPNAVAPRGEYLRVRIAAAVCAVEADESDWGWRIVIRPAP